MTQMSKEYAVAMARSYSGQKDEVVIPADKLGEITEIPLGFQPFGIASQGSRVAIAAYFEPAICLVQVLEDSGLKLEVSWIRGVQYRGKSIRLFPNIAKPVGANRAETVNFDRELLLVSRNGGRDFFTLVPSSQSPGWRLDGKITLPGSGMVHSALSYPTNNYLTVIESTMSLQSWVWDMYKLEEDTFRVAAKPSPIPEFMYGIGQRPGDDTLWFVTDFRCSSVKPGIYRGEKLVVPEVLGNGICFLPTGAALVSRYGQGHPFAFNGLPGALIYVPANLLK